MLSGKSEIGDTEGKKKHTILYLLPDVSVHDNACVTPRAVHAVLVRLPNFI